PTYHLRPPARKCSCANCVTPIPEEPAGERDLLRPCRRPVPHHHSDAASLGGKFILSSFTRKAYTSDSSSMILAVGLPAPWPARVSMRINTGASPLWQDCNIAANLNECPGTTRSSVSPVVTSVGGYCVPGFRLWYGEYLNSTSKSSFLSGEP